MPQTNKSQSAGCAPGQASAPDQGEPPPPASADDSRTQAAAASDDDDVEIIKSPSDPKKYRYIELSNGLRALLISDFSGSDMKDENGEDKASEEEEEGKGEDEGDSGEGSEEDEEDKEEAEQDSDFEELDEENTEEKKKGGSSEKQAAAALCISVGSFSDPDDLPGLAHFLEHMVFMGSEKYPAENGFDAFLKKHGGSDNASTDCERTIFQFDVQRKYFREALDRWAQFFICPLMIEDAIDREVEAVDSEYQLARPSDAHRKEMLFGSLAKPGHPMSKFCWGNAQTLKHEPREKQINTYQRLRHFWRRYYSAHYMTLAVQSKETLDTLEQWVREIFINVPKNGEPQPDFSHLQQPFDTPAFNKLYRGCGFRVPVSEDAPDSGSPAETDPIEFVENICENMQLFPKDDFLTGDQLMFEFDPQVTGPEEIPETWTRRWAGDFELNPELHLPAENKFIATDFTLKAADCPDSEFPVRVVNNERGCLWYKKDNKFKIPKAYVRFNLISPMIQRSPENLVLFDLFVNILAHNLAEPAYEADVAQLEYKLVAGEHGLVIRLKGFNHKLPLLLRLIVDHLTDFSAESGVFSMFSEQLKKTYFNILIKPERLGKDVRLMILEHCRWSVIQKYQAVTKGLTVDDLMTFVSGLKAELYTEGLVQGNFTSVESKEFLQNFTEKLQFQPLPAEVPVLFRVVELPQKNHLCKVKSLNKGDANSEVTVYYQSGLKNLRDHALMELMVMHMEEPCFDFLRTKETLGYQVYPTCRNTSGVLGFSVTVETQATKFSTEFVEAKIEEFLASFGQRLSALSDEAFRTQVTALVKLKECEDAHLGEEVDRNWFEVVTQQYVFDRLNKEIEALKLFRQPELVSWFLQHRSNSSRKLSVHVVGFGLEENDPPDQGAACGPGDSDGPPASAYGEVSELTFLSATSPSLQDAALITDIRAFTSSLRLHPYHKILS
ncbi:hypothetical protein F2P81_005149 [Scophthalmus maximus]|uniref:Nardilysin-like n=1 Tax=Scophthalmus maximus TaxID=52904 RepID=A0A6A4T5R6_SCOMX|nr:hypothetical protein F2P81_005149 [Scophthalmus maximus]